MAARQIGAQGMRERGNLSGNMAVELLSSVRARNSQIVNEASQQYLSMNQNAGESPKFLKAEWVIIDRLFESNEDPNVEILYEAMNEDDRPESPEDLYQHQESYKDWLMKAIFKLLRSEKTVYFGTVCLANSLMGIVAPRFWTSLEAICDKNSIIYERISLSMFLVLHPEYERVNPFDLSNYNNMNPSHLVFASSLFFTLIGKGLNSNNYTGWMAQRTRSFSRPLALSEQDNKLDFLRPSLTVFEKFYEEVRVFWDVRALYFGFMWSMSRGTDLRSRGFRVSINLLRNAEMTNFNMILIWILSANHILLAWNELGKYIPLINAAYSKFQQLGYMGPWAKMILPSDEVQEFSSEKLIILFSVARALSAKYGSATANQIEGINKNTTVEKIVQQSLKIVAIAGGARTIDVMAIRAWRLNGYQNDHLIRELDTGALNEPVYEPRIEDAVDVENRIA